MRIVVMQLLFVMFFYGCRNLTTIGDNTFANCSNAIYFDNEAEFGIFEDYTNLTTIGDNTFLNCSNVTDFSYTFENCTNLTTIWPNTFKGCNNVKTYKKTFYNCSSLIGQAIPLWLLVANGDYWNETPDGWECYYNCINLDDFEDIPKYWRGQEDGDRPQ